MSSLRVLLLAHGFPPESVGGVEQHVDGLARALAADGHAPHVYTRTGREGAVGTTDTVAAAARRPFPLTRVRYRWEGLRGLDDLYAVPDLDRALDAFLRAHAGSFDVAHVHHLTGLSTGSLAVLADHGIPTVLTLHDYWLGCPRGQMWHVDRQVCERLDVERCTGCLQRTFPGWLKGADPDADRATVERLQQRAKELLARPQALIVPSARVTPPFEALGISAERFTVVENGVDTDHLHPVAAVEATPEKPLRLGYLGTLIPSKGLDVLVEAVTRQPTGTVRLDIWGNAVPYHGDEGFLTRVFQKLGPEHRVHYHGPYRTPNLAQILGQVQLLAAPALWHEAFGLTVREALAAGRGVLVSDVGGLQDAVPDGVAGKVLPAGDVDAWAAAIGAAAKNRDQVVRWGAAARRHGRGFAAMARELVDVYRRCTRSS